MNGNLRTRTARWAWPLGLGFCGLAAGVMLWFQREGLRFDYAVSDPFLGFTRHQWGILLSGSFGAILAIAGVVATLGWQRRQFHQEQALIEERDRRTGVRNIATRVRQEMSNFEANLVQHGDGSLSGEGSLVDDIFVQAAGELMEFESPDGDLADVVLDVVQVIRAVHSGTILNSYRADEIVAWQDAFGGVQSTLAVWNSGSSARRVERLIEVRPDIEALLNICRKHAWPIIVKEPDDAAAPNPGVVTTTPEVRQSSEEP